VDSTIRFNQRLLTEAVRQLESMRGQPFDEPCAQNAGQAANGHLEQRLVARAEALQCAPALRTAKQQLFHMLGLSAGVLLLLAVMAGIGTAQLAFGIESAQPINVYWLLTVLLALPLLTLLLWGVLLFLPRGFSSNLLGKLVVNMGHWLNQRFHASDEMLTAVSRARSRLLLQGGSYWLFSTLSHALWLAYLVGMLAVTLVLLSIRQYGFVWETTILSADSYIALTQFLSSPLEWLGFPTPNAEQIMASRWDNGVLATHNAGAWSGFIVGCLMVYGVLPRLLFMLLSLFLYRHACQRVRLDINLPGYARLQDSLQPYSQSLGVVDPETEPLAAGQLATQPAIVALEAELSAEWPPALGHEWLDLGLIDDRRSRSRVLEQLAQSEPSPDRVAGTLVIVCSLTMTPDRGIGRMIEQLTATTPGPVLLLLSDGQRLRQREIHDEVMQRITDWQHLGIQAGLAETHILELDLNHLTDTSRSKLAGHLGLTYQPSSDSGSRFEPACTLIVAHVEGWSQPPDATAQAELQRAIARLYGHRRETFRIAMPTLDLSKKSVRAQLQHSAEWGRQILPPRLRSNPRWLAAGALSGALGCVALATLTTTAALAALPLWSGLGATLSLFMTPRPPTQTVAEQQLDLAEPVAAAALFTLLLELQGRTEAEITAALDQLLDAQMPVIHTAKEARLWLDELGLRYARWREGAQP
jgi:hypothetical protein